MPREITTDDLADEWAARQERNAGNCKCRGEMPGSCPGPANCPMCQPSDEEEAVAADLAYNASKATFHETNDARALLDQIMLNTLLRSSM
jgi:hypothetical protein